MPIQAVPHVVAIESNCKFDLPPPTTATSSSTTENDTAPPEGIAATTSPTTTTISTEQAIQLFHQQLEQDPRRRVIHDMSVRLAPLDNTSHINALALAVSNCTVRYLNLWGWTRENIINHNHTANEDARLAMTALLCQELASITTARLDLDGDLLQEPRLLAGVLKGLEHSKDTTSSSCVALKIECNFVENHNPHIANNNSNNINNNHALDSIAQYCVKCSSCKNNNNNLKKVNEIVLNLPRVTANTWQNLVSLLRSSSIKDMAVNPAMTEEENAGLPFETEEPTPDMLSEWQAALASNSNLEEFTISFDLPESILVSLCQGLCENKTILNLRLHLSVTNVRTLMNFLPRFTGLRSLNVVLLGEAISQKEKDELASLTSTALRQNTSLLYFACNGFDQEIENQKLFSDRNLALIMIEAASDVEKQNDEFSRGTNATIDRATLGGYFGKLSTEHADVAASPFYTLLQRWYVPQSLH